jgi:hypothetical protein
MNIPNQTIAKLYLKSPIFAAFFFWKNIAVSRDTRHKLLWCHVMKQKIATPLLTRVIFTEIPVIQTSQGKWVTTEIALVLG